ncbi:MAG: hypothetical protein S4CHLAM20_12450 [Chlamydiia bacterium]|nr:hypothetical protein [Chlamydiia bacterium]
MKKNILILTLKAGSGHLQAAKSKQLEHKKLGHNVIEKRVLFDLVGNIAGLFVSKIWNYCQAQGVSSLLFFFSICCRTFDVLVFPFFFVKLSYVLYKEDIDEVIDTQPFGTRSFIKSIRLISKLTNKKIPYKIVLTDLPTKKCASFLKPIKNLSKIDRDHIEILTTKPMLAQHETEEDFWLKNTKLPLERIYYTEFPLRETFTTYKESSGPLQLQFKAHSDKGLDLIKKCLNLSSASFEINKRDLSFVFEEEILSLIILGTYPQKSALINYMTQYIEQKKTYRRDSKEYLFLLVGPKKTANKHYLSIYNALKEIKDYPKNLCVVPLSFQDDKALAPLYFNLDFIIAKSGGLTSMELLKAVKKNIFIHDDPEHNNSNYLSFLTKDLFDSMPLWERGNAEYLMDKKAAKLINPKLFKIQTIEFFKELNFAQVSAQ